MKFLLEHPGAGLFLDPGLGKTAITLGVLKILKEKNLLKRALVISPLRVCYSVWPEELELWKDFHNLTYAVLHGKDKNQALHENVDIHIINPEGLAWLIDPTIELTKTGKKRIKVDIQRFKSLGYDILILDELTRFKHMTSQRARMMKPLLHTFTRKWGLTGSPAANGLLDLFGQIYMLDEGKTFGRYYTRFRQQYFHTIDFNQREWTLRYGCKEIIYKKIAPIALRMSAEEYGSLPPLIEQTLTVNLPPSVRTIYDKVEERFFALIGKKTLTASNAAVASTKCHQIANGGVFLDYEILEAGVKPQRQQKEYVQLHYEKVDVVEDLYNELQGQPLLVTYDFKHDLARFQERFGHDVPYIGGGVNTGRAKALVDAWNRGEIPILFGHPQSLGHGVNMQAGGHHICWASLIWNYELYDQFIRRLFRAGQKAPRVFSYRIICKDTIDEVILTTLRSKQLTQQGLFTALTDYRKKRLHEL